MELIKVDYDKCIKCGICVDICPSCILEMGEAGPRSATGIVDVWLVDIVWQSVRQQQWTTLIVS